MKKNEDAARIPANVLARCPEYHEAKLNEGFNSGRANVSSSFIKKNITFYFDNL